MKKENLIIIVGLVYLFTLLSFYIYIKDNNKQIKQADEQKTENLQKWFDKQIQIAAYDVAKVQLIDSTNIPMPMVQLAKKGTRIGFFVCDISNVAEWEKELHYLKTFAAQNVDMEQPFFFTRSMHGRELRIIKREYAIPFPVYSYYPTFGQDDIVYLTMLGRSFFFVLNPDGMISSIIFPDEAIRPLITTYFKTWHTR